MTHFDTPASEYMSAPVRAVDADESVLRAEVALEDEGITAVAVRTGETLVGVLSRTDLLRAATEERGGTFALPDVPVHQLMSPSPIRVEVDTPLHRVAALMLEERVHRVFVERAGELVGVLSTRDIMRAVEDAQLGGPICRIASSPVARIEVHEPLAIAVQQLEDRGHHGLIVVEEGDPVGTFSQLDALFARARDPRTPVGEVMEVRTLSLSHRAPLHRAAQRASAMNVRRFVLLDREEMVGVVSTFDFCRVVADP